MREAALDQYHPHASSGNVAGSAEWLMIVSMAGRWKKLAGGESWARRTVLLAVVPPCSCSQLGQTAAFLGTAFRAWTRSEPHGGGLKWQPHDCAYSHTPKMNTKTQVSPPSRFTSPISILCSPRLIAITTSGCTTSKTTA